MDFPQAHSADTFRLLGYPGDDIIIEFGEHKSGDPSVITLLASVRMSRELALSLSTSINNKLLSLYLIVKTSELFCSSL